MKRFVFDIELMRPACPLLQAVMGGDIEAVHRIPSELWLLAPTPNMKTYAISSEQLEHVVKKLGGLSRESRQAGQGHHQDAERAQRSGACLPRGGRPDRRDHRRVGRSGKPV